MFQPATDSVTARPIHEARLQRTVLTAARKTASNAPAITAAREAFRQTAQYLAEQRTDVETSLPELVKSASRPGGMTCGHT
jgi:hypothetical protein